MKKIFIIFLAILILLFYVLFHKNNKENIEKITLAEVTHSIFYAPLYVAIENGYFTLEELSRISTILPYKELDRDTKIKILKESKLSTLAQKKSRYKRQFNLDIETTDDFIDAIIEKLDKSETGMRSLNNILKKIMDCAEKEIITTNNQYKKLVLTKNTVDNPTKFELL